jgi:hypothetical protein
MTDRLDALRRANERGEKVYDHMHEASRLRARTPPRGRRDWADLAHFAADQAGMSVDDQLALLQLLEGAGDE